MQDFSVLFDLFHFRFDPTAALDDKPETPLEIAAARNSLEVFKILSEHKDMSSILKLDLQKIPDNVKILQLWMLIREGLEGEGKENDGKKLKEEFQKILLSLPLQTVKHLFLLNPPNQNIQVSLKNANGYGTLLQTAVTENKTDLVRLLLEFG